MLSIRNTHYGTAGTALQADQIRRGHVRTELVLARQTAVTTSRVVHVRFYKVPDQTATGTPLVYRGMPCFVSTNLPMGVNGPRLSPLSPPIWFARPVILSDNVQASSFLSTADQPADPDYPFAP